MLRSKLHSSKFEGFEYVERKGAKMSKNHQKATKLLYLEAVMEASALLLRPVRLQNPKGWVKYSSVAWREILTFV